MRRYFKKHKSPLTKEEIDHYNSVRDFLFDYYIEEGYNLLPKVRKHVFDDITTIYMILKD